MSHLIDRVNLWVLNVEGKKEKDIKRQNRNKRERKRKRQMEGQRDKET